MIPQTSEEALKIIHSICPETKVIYSPWTDKFYVSTNIEIGKDGFLTGIVEHRDTINDAIWAYWNCLTEIKIPETLVINAMSPNRAEYRWNGFLFHKIG